MANHNSTNDEILLANIARRISLTQEEKDFIIPLLHERTVKRKQFLLREGEICRFDSFILQGCVRLFSKDLNGAEHTISFAWDNWWTSDMKSLVQQIPATMNIEALEDTQVVQIARGDIDRLYEAVPKFERFFRMLTQNRMIALQERIYEGLSLTAEQRYTRFIEKYPDIEQRIPQKYIASYLGITPVFLSMLRSKRKKLK